MTFDGITIKGVASKLIPGTEDPKSALAFQFSDGRNVVGKNNARWSIDRGDTWSAGPDGPGDKVAIDLGQGELLSIGAKSKNRGDGRYSVKQRRSLDNRASQNNEEAILDTPEAS